MEAYKFVLDKHNYVINLISIGFNCVFILLTIEFCQTSKYFSERLISNSSDIHDESISNYVLDTKDSNYNSLLIHQCPIKCFIEHDSRDMVNCISNEDKKSPKLKMISCERNTEAGVLVLGHKESVRGIVPGALSHLLQTSSPTSTLLSRSGQLEFHLNLNMLRLDARCFQGLGGLITDVRLLNTVYMHPDSLIDLQHLRSFEMESGQTPLYLSDDYVENGKYFQSNVEEAIGQINKPVFIRLNPLDNTVPITFNLNTKCHKCALIDDNDVSNSNDMNDRSQKKPDNLIIIVFTNKRDLPTSQYSSLKLSMIFPYTCPLIKDGIGCLRQSDLTGIDQDNSTEMISLSNKQSLPESRSEPSLLNISVIEQLKTMTSIQTESKHTLSLSIILIIWCTIITISFIVVILIVLYCIKNRFIKIPLSTKVTQITPFSLFHFCGQQNSSIDGDEMNGNDDDNDDGDMEEISSNSVSSGFFAQQPKTYVTSEKKELLPYTSDNMTNFIISSKNTRNGTNGTRSSWSSLQITNNPSINTRTIQCRCSVISLKDSKPTNSNTYGALCNILQSNKHNNQQHSDKRNNHYPYKKTYLSKRRSIGSQTDFTDIESDNAEAYCTLDRYIMQKHKRYPYTANNNNNNNDNILSKRTASNHIFPYFRNNNLNQMDGIVITKSSIYSNNLFSHSNITMNNNTSANNDNTDSNMSRTFQNYNDTSVAKRPINNGTDVFILMIDNKSKSVRNLPRTNPIRQLSNPVNKQGEYMKRDWKHHEVSNGSVI